MRFKGNKIGILVLAVILTFAMIGCGNGDQGTSNGLSYEGSLTLSGLESPIAIAYDDIYAMTPVTREVKNVSSSGEESINTVTGVLLSDILAANNIDLSQYNMMRFIAGDGYAIDATSDVFSDKEIILAYEFDGQPLDEKQMPLRIAMNDVRTMYYVSNLIEINFSKSEVTTAESEAGTASTDTFVVLETAISGQESETYTYYENEDQAVKVKSLLDAYVKSPSENVTFVATDGFEKSETYDVLGQGYIKYTGEDAPLFTAPDFPKGMNVKYILTLDAGDVTFVSMASAIESLEQRTIEDNTGVALDVLINALGLEGDYYTFTAADGYSAEVSKAALSQGIVHLNNSNQYKVKFDASLPKASGVKDVLTIAVSDGANALDIAAGENTSTESADSSASADSSDQTADMPVWTITFDGLSDGSFDLSSEKASKKIDRVSLHTERKKDDVVKPEDWEGYKLNDVLAFLHVDSYNSLLITASDGYEMEFTPDQIDDETILAVMKDGSYLSETDNRVQLVQNTEFSTSWVKGVTKITVK